MSDTNEQLYKVLESQAALIETLRQQVDNNAKVIAALIESVKGVAKNTSGLAGQVCDLTEIVRRMHWYYLLESERPEDE